MTVRVPLATQEKAAYDLEIDIVSELKPVIVGAHVIVACPERHFEVEAILDVRHPFDQRWGYNGDVVKLQHVRRTPVQPRESI